jgi:hypothetical protein
MSSVFDNIARIKTPLQLNFSTANGPHGSDASSGGNVDLIAETWQFSNVNDDVGSNNFYLLSVTGSISLNLNGTLKIDRYGFNFIPENTDSKLIDFSPATTIGNKSVSIGVSSSVSGSVGFFGGTGTGTVGESRSVSSSTTYSAPDVEIYAHAYNGEGCQSAFNNACWHYGVGEGSNVQNSDLSVCMQSLYMNTFASDAKSGEWFTINATIEIHVSDHDGGHGTRWFDHMQEELTSCLPPGTSFHYDDDRVGTITFPKWPIKIKVPPPPK